MTTIPFRTGKKFLGGSLIFAFLAVAKNAWAATGSAMAPWDSGLIMFIGSIQNDAKILAGLGVIVAGAMAIFGGHGVLFRMIMGVIAGLCAVTFGSTYIPGLWGVSF